MGNSLPATRNTILLGAALVTAAVLAFTASAAGRERGVHLRDWAAYQSVTRLIDEQKDYKEAERLLAGVLERNPQSYILLWRYGFTQAVAGRHAEALDYYERARRLNRYLVHDANYLILVGDSLFRTGEYRKARAYLEEAIRRGGLDAGLTRHAQSLLEQIRKKGVE